VNLSIQRSRNDPNLVELTLFQDSDSHLFLLPANDLVAALPAVLETAYIMAPDFDSFQKVAVMKSIDSILQHYDEWMNPPDPHKKTLKHL
jgi:hypothetical protein